MTDTGISSPRELNFHTNLKVYRTLFDVQPELMSLYSGPINSIFQELKCISCGHLPIEAKTCLKCDDYICKPCLVKEDASQRQCNSCKTSFDEDSNFKAADKLLKTFLDDATFQCVYKCEET